MIKNFLKILKGRECYFLPHIPIVLQNIDCIESINFFQCVRKQKKINKKLLLI